MVCPHIRQRVYTVHFFLRQRFGGRILYDKHLSPVAFTQLFSGVLTIIGTLVFMIAINWKIALVVVILTPISLLVAKFIGSSTHNMFKARSKANGTATAIIDEVIGNQKVVVAFVVMLLEKLHSFVEHLILAP
jgi:ABC-type multidrug transport system fused ATPase/permease subunit